jgi:predicted TIM-barrel fold metal-dependent hydrolase
VTNAPIVNVHEHIASAEQAAILLGVMDAVGIESTVLLGSSLFTLTLDYRFGFTGYDENNEELLRVHRRAPDRFEAWPTLRPDDPDKLQKLESMHARGASGVKLFIGHGYIPPDSESFLFHTMPIDDDRMSPVYDYCSRHRLPICLHVNPSASSGRFLVEFQHTLREFPDLHVIAPHWALSSIRIGRLAGLLEEFPNLMTDISFGHDTYLAEGLRRISANPEKYRNFIADFSDRLLFGTDLVLTAEPRKSAAWITSRTSDYIHMLTEARFASDVLPGEELSGLALELGQVVQILSGNYKAFRASASPTV